MMDQIQQIVNQLTEKEVVGNNNISNNLAGDVAKETGSSLMEGLQNAVSGGNRGGVDEYVCLKRCKFVNKQPNCEKHY